MGGGRMVRGGSEAEWGGRENGGGSESGEREREGGMESGRGGRGVGV